MKFVIAACLIALASQAGGGAQAAAKFEVASVKQAERSLRPGTPDLSFVGKAGKIVQITGNRVTYTGTLRALIGAAYDVKDYQILGVPSWTGTLIYQVAAETPGEKVFTHEQIRPMLQALLADRFQLKAHHGSKQMAVYHMFLDKKNGLKPPTPDEVFGWRVTREPNGQLRSKATRITIGDFVDLVGMSTGKPVIDKTRYTGELDYEILLSQDDTKTQDDANPAIVSAVKEQLGVKLESVKEPVETLVIDRVEKPSEN